MKSVQQGGGWPSVVYSLRKAREAGKIASLYVQPDIGGDLALLVGVAKRIDEMGATDETFLDRHCTGWPELADALRQLPWEDSRNAGRRRIVTPRRRIRRWQLQ